MVIVLYLLVSEYIFGPCLLLLGERLQRAIRGGIKGTMTRALNPVSDSQMPRSSLHVTLFQQCASIQDKRSARGKGGGINLED